MTNDDAGYFRRLHIKRGSAYYLSPATDFFFLFSLPMHLVTNPVVALQVMDTGHIPDGSLFIYLSNMGQVSH